MSNCQPHQFRLTDVLLAFTLVAGVLGLAHSVGLFVALLLGVVASLFAYAWTKRAYWIMIAVLQVASILAIGCFQVFQVSSESLYVKSYNFRLDALAKDAKLVGADEDVVEKVLGTPTSVSKEWDRTRMDTGEPTPDAKFTTTYNYAPYPWFPYAKFQVHCEKGKVVSTEMFDD